jgi:hypothetical protein
MIIRYLHKTTAFRLHYFELKNGSWKREAVKYGLQN